MAPAANTARPRRVTGSARALADSDSDAEYQAYNSRLQEASAARARLRKAKQIRDQKRTALATAYSAALTEIESRVQKSVAKHRDLRSATTLSHLSKLQRALARRDEAAAQLARRLADHRRRMLNLGVQLQALYAGRREDVAGVLAQLEREGKEQEQQGKGQL